MVGATQVRRALKQGWMLVGLSLTLATTGLGADIAPTPLPTVPVLPENPATAPTKKPALIVEEFTAAVLDQGGFKVGTDLDYGISNHLMIGTDMVADLIGAPSLQVKGQVWTNGPNTLSLGLRGAYLTKRTLLWGNMDEHFTELSAKVIRPSVSWTHQVSARLKLHTFWGIGLGSAHAVLSDKGRRKLWELKHADEPFPGDEGSVAVSTDPATTRSKENQEKSTADDNTTAQRTTQVQSIAGLAQDRFQISGEFARQNGHRVLITSRIERTEIEEFKSNSFVLTIAQHWIWKKFQIRLGGGFQYMELRGNDLDGEALDEARWWPATDVVFYWRL